MSYVDGMRERRRIPDGKSCGSCAWFMKCEGLIQVKRGDAHCDWYPVRYREAERERSAELEGIAGEAGRLSAEVDEQTERIAELEAEVERLRGKLECHRCGQEGIKTSICHHCGEWS